MFVPRAATRPTPLSHIACRSIRSATLGMLSPPFYPAYANGGVGFMSVVGNREVVRVCFFLCGDDAVSLSSYVLHPSTSPHIPW
jgi:hypothetical protein